MTWRQGVECGPGLPKASYVAMGRLLQTIDEYLANKTFGLYVHKLPARSL